MTRFFPVGHLLPQRHCFIGQELNRTGTTENDNAFLSAGDVTALQAAADCLSPQLICKRLDYSAPTRASITVANPN